MQLYCQECRKWMSVLVLDGEDDVHAGSRTRRAHRCMGPVLVSFDAIVGEELGTTGTTPPR